MTRSDVDFRALDAASLPDTLGPMRSWLDEDPSPRRPKARPAALVAICVLVLAACAVPVEVERGLGQAIMWTSSMSPDEAGQTSQGLFLQIGNRPVLGYRIERDDADRFVHRLSIADATSREANEWALALAANGAVTDVHVESVTEAWKAPLLTAVLSKLRLITAPEIEQHPRMTLEEEMVSMNEVVGSQGFEYEMIEILPPAPGSDQRRRRFRTRLPDGTVDESEVGERVKRSREEVLRDRQGLVDGLRELGLDTTQAPSVEDVLRFEGYE